MILTQQLLNMFMDDEDGQSKGTSINLSSSLNLSVRQYLFHQGFNDILQCQKAVPKIPLSLCGALLQTIILYFKKKGLLCANLLKTQKREKFVLTLFILVSCELQVRFCDLMSLAKRFLVEITSNSTYLVGLW